MRGATPGQRQDARGGIVRLSALFMIAAATALRLWNVADPATLNLHVIRQMFGAMQARNIAQGATDWLQPSIDVAWFPGNPPWFVALEFPLVQLTTAAIYSVFGVHTWIGNVLSITFSALAAWVFFLIARKLFNSDVAALSALLPFLFLPEAFKYSRLIQPEPLSLLLLLLVVYCTLRWTEPRGGVASAGRGWLIAALAAMGLMLLNKVNWAPFALVPAGIILLDYGWRRLLRPDVAGGALVAAAPAALWYVLASRAAEFDHIGTVASNTVEAMFLSRWYDVRFWSAVADGIAGWLFAPGIIIAFAGFLFVLRDRKGRSEAILLVWLLATALYLYMAGAELLSPHRYYFVPILPVACLLIGRAFGFLADRPQAAIASRPPVTAALSSVLAVTLALGSWWMLRGYYAETRREMQAFERAGELISTHTEPGDLVVFETEDYGVTLYIAYVSERFGWTNLDAEELQTVIDRGAAYAFVSSALYAEKYFDTPGEAALLDTKRTAVVDAGGEPVASGEAGTLFRFEEVE